MGCVRFGLMSLEEMQHVARSQRLELELKRDTLAAVPWPLCGSYVAVTGNVTAKLRPWGRMIASWSRHGRVMVAPWSRHGRVLLIHRFF